MWGLCTATNENCDFVSILENMNKLGFQNVQIRLVRSSKKLDIDKIIYQYNRLYRLLFDHFKSGNLTFLRMILNDNDQFGKVLKRVILNQLLIRRCSAGVNKITVCPDGSIYPCDSLVGIPNSLLGNIYGIERNLDFYKQTTVNNIFKCSICDAKYLCGGDCYYNAYMKNSNQFIPDQDFCAIQRCIINISIVFRFRMQMEDELLYNSLLKEVRIKNEYSELWG